MKRMLYGAAVLAAVAGVSVSAPAQAQQSVTVTKITCIYEQVTITVVGGCPDGYKPRPPQVAKRAPAPQRPAPVCANCAVDLAVSYVECIDTASGRVWIYRSISTGATFRMNVERQGPNDMIRWHSNTRVAEWVRVR